MPATDDYSTPPLPPIDPGTALNRSRPSFRHRFPYRFTLPGAIYLGAAAFVFIATTNSGTNLLYMVFGLMVGAIFVSLVFSAASLRKVTVTRSFGEHVVAGEPADIQYTITNGKRHWPCMALRFYERHDQLDKPAEGFVLYIPRKSSVSLSAQIVPRYRGILRLSTITLSSAFPFGFLARVVQSRQTEEMIVYPRIGLLNRHLALQYRESIETGTMTSNVRGGNDEFYGLREYRPGDNIRTIHWRSTARTRQLMIREMSANAPPQMIVLLNLRQYSAADRDAAERAIEVAASLICYGFMENFAVGLAIAGVDTDIPPSPQMGREARAQMLRRLAMLDPREVRSDAGIATPNRLAGRAEWIVVTLHASDPIRDLLSPSSSGSDPSRSGHHTVLPLDAPESATWLHFLSPHDTVRLLRDRTDLPP